MIIFIGNLLSWMAFFIFLFVLCLMILWMWSSLWATVPFIGVPILVLKDIEKELELKDGGVVYDLGCGDGRVLFYLAKNNPKYKYIGIENSLFPFILVRFLSWWNKKMNKIEVEIIRKDIFDVNLSNATHIFTYLYPNIMDDLLSKFDRELKRGTRLVSASFHFTNKREIREVNLQRGKYQLAKKLYVYEF